MGSYDRIIRSVGGEMIDKYLTELRVKKEVNK